MPRSTAAAITAAFLAGLAGSLLIPQANATDDDLTRAVCVQVPQKPSQLDEGFVARFIDEQRAQDRKHFESLTGLSTVLCAW